MAISACALPRTAPYRRRRPERTLLYRTVQTHLATWLERTADCWPGGSAPAHVEREFRRYRECGILAHGFARARCAECGHDYLIAYSCKGRGVCPSCNTRCMVETAAHLAKRLWGFTQVRYRGLEKNATRSFVALGLANAYLARQHLMA